MNQDLRANIGRLPFNYSTYVALAICYALDWWMDPANAGAKADLLLQFPFLAKLGGPVSFALWLASRTWPQAGSAATNATPVAEVADTVPMREASNERLLQPVVVQVPKGFSIEETRTILEAARLLQARQEGRSA